MKIKVQVGPTQLEGVWKIRLRRKEQICDLMPKTELAELMAREEAGRIAEFLQCELEVVERILL